MSTYLCNFVFHFLCSAENNVIEFSVALFQPSSCLSDKEEDEIYGFGYGVFGAQIARQQQQRLMGATPTSHQPLLLQHHHNYQT